MAAFFRALPGFAALSLIALALFLPSEKLSPFKDAAISQQTFFTASHIGSTLLYAVTPIAFALIAKATNCHQHRRKVGTVLLSISVLPLLAVNIIDLATSSPQDPGADIGGTLLELLGLTASVITSLVFTFVLPLAGRANAYRADSK
jgi:hypothetical protein